MISIRSGSSFLAAGLLWIAACSSPGALRSTAPFRPIAGDDAIFLWSKGRDACLPDPKDAQLRAALDKGGARIAELPAELGDDEIPAAALQLAFDVLGGPLSLRGGLDAKPAKGALPVWARTRFASSSSDDANERAARLVKVITDFGLASGSPDAQRAGLAPVTIDKLKLWHGVPRGDTALALELGTPHGADPDLGTLDLPDGVAPCAAFRLDLDQIARLSALDPKAKKSLDMAQMKGVVLQGGLGHGTDRLYGALRTRGWTQLMQKTGLMASGPIPRAAFELVPEDATMVSIGRIDPHGIAGRLREAAKMTSAKTHLPPDTDPIELLANVTGFDLEHDLLDHLGETYGMYMSDSTGGGGFWSAVAFIEISDAKGFADALEQLDGFVGDLEGGNAEGRVHLRHWKSGEHDVVTITIPGLPVPLEISYALEKGWFFASLSPQGLLAALDQAATHEHSFLDRADVRSSSAGDGADLYELTYLDTVRFARDGYPVAAMFGSMVSNALSSPAAPERARAGITPGYSELVRDARPFVMTGRRTGDDFVLAFESDRSLFVNMAGAIGALGPLPFIAGAALAGADAKKSKKHEEPAAEMQETDDDENDMEGATAPTPDGMQPVTTPKEDPK